MDRDQLAQALAALPVGPLRYFDRTGSTNTEAVRWVEAGAPDLALVVADEQTAGRGRLNRRWLTPPGAALAFSLVLRPGAEKPGQPAGETASETSRLTALGALAVRAALAGRWDLPAAIKWPNDVLVDGRKLAGILVEAHWQGNRLVAAVLGIGVNVAASSEPPPQGLNYLATSVETCLLDRGVSISPDRLGLLVETLRQVLAWRPRLASPEFLQAWEAALAFRGEWVYVDGYIGDGYIGDGYIGDENIQATTKAGPAAARREGLVLGLAPNGALRLRDPSGLEYAVQAGEVRLRPRGEP